MDCEMAGQHLPTAGEDPEVASRKSSDVASEKSDSGNKSMDSFSRSDVDFADVEAVKYITSVPAPKRHRKKKHGKNRQNQNPFPAEKQSRARPLKSHESQPFLSVDNVPVNTSHQSGTSRQHSGKYPLFTVLASGSFCNPGAPTNTPANTIRSAGSKRTRATTPNSHWNPLVPKQDKLLAAMVPNSTRVNHHLKSPFKHSVKKQPSRLKRVPSPSLEMKQKTVLATQQVARILAKQSIEQDDTVQGKLLKGKLKPLNVVEVAGPTMRHCKGIVSDSKNYDTISSRTLQRRRELVAGLMQNNNSYNERPQTVESMHHTSIASDLSENRLDEVNLEIEVLERETLQGAHYSSLQENTIEQPTGRNSEEPDNILADELAEHNRITPKPLSTQNHENSSESFFVTEDHYEEDYENDNHGKENDDVKSVKSNDISRPTSSGSTRSILKDVPSQPISGARQVDSAGDAPRMVESRPSTGNDPKKAVRFAEEDSVEIISARNKSNSAMSKLSSQSNKEKEVEPESCKPNEMKNSTRNDDSDDEDQPRPNGGGDQIGNHNTGTTILGSASAASKSESGSKQTKKGKQNRGSGKMYDNRESVDSVMFSKENNFRTTLHPRPPSASRPRSRLGAWEDLCKPDGDISSLKIEGSHVDADPDLIESKHLVSYDFITFNRFRQGSVEVPCGYSSSDTRMKIYKGRPASAHELSRKARDQVMEEREKINSVKFCRTAGVVPRASSAIKRRRPMSGICIANSQAGLKVSVNNTSFETDLALHGNRMKKTVKAGMCSRCKRPFDECFYTDDPGCKLVCSKCYAVIDNERRTKLKEHLLKSIQQDEGDELSGEPVDIDDYITGLERELDRRAKRTERKLSQPLVENERQQDNFMSTLELLEQSLNTVQADIRSCMEPMEQTAEEMSKAVVPIEQHLSLADCDLGYASEREEDTGHISKVLTDREAYELNQYRQRMEERKSTRSRLCSGSTIRSRPDSGQSVKTRPQSSVRPRINSTASSGICSAKTFSVAPDERGTVSPIETNGEFTLEPYHQQQEEETESAISGTSSTETDSVLGDSNKHSVTPPEYEDDGLSVVATAKTINLSEEEDRTPIAPFPPMCFRLNARPPPGHIYYFAYGLNMNHDRMCNSIKRDITHRLWGLLFGFKLTFNKRGVDSEAGGFPNVEFNSNSSVEGVVYLLRQEELKVLDSAMGYPQHYEHVMLPVWMCNCDQPDDYGVAQYCVPALVYIAQDNYTHKGENLPCQYSVDQCLKSSTDILTTNYREFLQTLAKPKTTERYSQGTS